MPSCSTPEHVPCVDMVRHVVKPVTVREAQEYFEKTPAFDAEPDGFGPRDVEARHGLHHAIGQHQQAALHVDNQRKQKELVRNSQARVRRP